MINEFGLQKRENNIELDQTKEKWRFQGCSQWVGVSLLAICTFFLLTVALGLGKLESIQEIVLYKPDIINSKQHEIIPFPRENQHEEFLSFIYYSLHKSDVIDGKLIFTGEYASCQFFETSGIEEQVFTSWRFPSVEFSILSGVSEVRPTSYKHYLIDGDLLVNDKQQEQ